MKRFLIFMLAASSLFAEEPKPEAPKVSRAEERVRLVKHYNELNGKFKKAVAEVRLLQTVKNEKIDAVEKQKVDTQILEADSKRLKIFEEMLVLGKKIRAEAKAPQSLQSK